jgi:hypothetical protein
MVRHAVAYLIPACLVAGLLFSGEDPFIGQRERMVREQI